MLRSQTKFQIFSRKKESHAQEGVHVKFETSFESLSRQTTIAERKLTEYRHRLAYRHSQKRMSSDKWQTINGLRYQVEDNGWENPDEDNGWEEPKENTFTHNGEKWDVVREITLEEVIAITRKKKDWTKATDEELMIGAFGEGIPGMTSHSTETS